MIVGLGIDLCSVERMKRAIRSDHFVKRVFHPSEAEYAFSKAVPALHLAGSFAAREAFCKASGVNMYSAAFGGVWVERTGSAPLIRTSDKVASLIPPHKRGVPLLSITHDGNFAAAVVAIEGSAVSPVADFFTNEGDWKLLPNYGHDIHKGGRGGVIVVGGSSMYRGASVLTLRAFLRSGGGYGVLFSDEAVCAACACSLPEAIVLNGLFDGDPGKIRQVLADWGEKADCLVLGPGLGRSEGAGEVFSLVMELWQKNVIIDGDGLYWLARGRGRTEKKRTILTPHEGEAAMLLRTSVAEIRNDRPAAARRLAEEWGTTVLKGPGSIVGDGQRAIFVGRANRALAVPGSGDVLCGVIAAFVAGGLPLFEGASMGARIHGAAGEALASRLGHDGILAGELADEIPAILNAVRSLRI
ncbi:MAG: NAD(P)H-hydrate dehydratase [Aminivibrio sp.]